jgi:hypothetical protein
LEAVASFVEHREVNPGMHLRFRYTTNAQVTCERPAAFDNGEAAINVWKKLNGGAIQGQPAEDAVKRIREFLLNQHRPEKLNSATWDRFNTFLKSAAAPDILRLIRNFEWATSEAPDSALADLLNKQLMSDGYASNHDHGVIWGHHTV